MAPADFFLTISPAGSDLPNLVQREVKEQLCCEEGAERFGQARFFFSADLADVPIERFFSLCSPEKVYAVVLRVPTAELLAELADLPGPAAEEALADRIAKCGGWSQALETWQAFAACKQDVQQDFAAVAQTPQTFRVTGKRAGKLMSHLSSNGMSEAIGESVAASQGWEVTLRSFDVEVVVHLNDEMLVVALPLLERSGSVKQATFALPGLTQPVAWAMGRSASIAPGEVVIDPMCGSGIILLEAAQCWNEASFLGFDDNVEQVRRTAANADLLVGASRTALNVALGDARHLPLADCSCDVILCDLPFGKLYGSEAANESLYPAVVDEFRRVLRPCTGRAVLLTNQANADRLTDALLASPRPFAVTCRRRLSLGFMKAVLFVAVCPPPEGHCDDSSGTRLPPESCRLQWEDDRGRAKWTSFKAMARQPLRPVRRGREA